QPFSYGFPTFRREFALQLPILQSFALIPSPSVKISNAGRRAPRDATRAARFIEFSGQDLFVNYLARHCAMNTAFRNISGLKTRTTFLRLAITPESV
ncbi:MAG TPA: hypothetical protein VN113_07125, partial [Caulobacter sp.]|nr:hypothetical protein [Caulobacter sp.]